MKHIESAHQAQVIEWSRWAFKANPVRYNLIMLSNKDDTNV